MDFRRQLHERDHEHTAKKIRSTAAPKGVKLGKGYRDRTKDRVGDGDGEKEDKVERVRALEELFKLGQIEREVFEKLRDEIVGGDVRNVHLKKGLDFALLERARRGEDLLASLGSESVEDRREDGGEAGEEKDIGVDVDAELERLEAENVKAVSRKREEGKKGEMRPPLLPSAGTGRGKKRSRDEILAELKASREAAKKPSLGPRFKKFIAGDAESGGSRKSRIEIDGRGREVLITVDEDGKIKRRVRRVQKETDGQSLTPKLLIPDQAAEKLGSEVQDIVETRGRPKSADAEEETGDIFEGAGDDYDPLAGLDEDSTSSEGDDDEIEGDNRGEEDVKREVHTTDDKSASTTEAREIPASTPNKRRDYFLTSNTPSTSSTQTDQAPPVPKLDPNILASLRKASHLTLLSSSLDASDEAAAALRIEREKAERHAAMLSGVDRDAEDLDMGFGGSRGEDLLEGEEGDGKGKPKLSVWGEEQKGGRKKRGGGEARSTGRGRGRKGVGAK